MTNIIFRVFQQFEMLFLFFDNLIQFSYFYFPIMKISIKGTKLRLNTCNQFFAPFLKISAVITAYTFHFRYDDSIQFLNKILAASTVIMNFFLTKKRIFYSMNRLQINSTTDLVIFSMFSKMAFMIAFCSSFRTSLSVMIPLQSFLNTSVAFCPKRTNQIICNRRNALSSALYRYRTLLSILRRASSVSNPCCSPIAEIFLHSCSNSA